MTTEKKKPAVDHEKRIAARIRMIGAASENRDIMSKKSWLRAVALDQDAIDAYQGDKAALARESKAIAEMLWPK